MISEFSTIEPRMNSLGIEVENHKYIRFLDLDKPDSKTLFLTSLKDFQKRADIKIFLNRENEREQIKTITLTPLPREKSDELKIDLVGNFDGRKHVSLKVLVDQRPFHEETIRIKGLRPKSPAPLLWIAGLLGLAAIITFSILVINRSGTTTDTPPSVSQNGESPVSEVNTAEPTPQDTQQESREPQTSTSSSTETSTETSTEMTTDAPEPEQAAASTEPDGTVKEDEAEETVAESTEAHSPPTSESEKEQTTPVPVILPDKVTIYFEPNSSRLTREAESALDNLLREIQDGNGYRVIIKGYCAPKGSEKGRREISDARAENVENYLRQNGWNPETAPETEGRGSTDPVTYKEEDMALNRRVEISFTRI